MNLNFEAKETEDLSAFLSGGVRISSARARSAPPSFVWADNFSRLLLRGIFPRCSVSFNHVIIVLSLRMNTI